jgi:hypothetical protein
VAIVLVHPPTTIGAACAKCRDVEHQEPTTHRTRHNVLGTYEQIGTIPHGERSPPLNRLSERLSTLSESAKRAEDVLDAVRANNPTRPESRRESKGRSLAGWIMSNDAPLPIIGTAAVMRSRHRRNEHRQEIAGRDRRRPGFLR